MEDREKELDLIFFFKALGGILIFMVTGFSIWLEAKAKESGRASMVSSALIGGVGKGRGLNIHVDGVWGWGFKS